MKAPGTILFLLELGMIFGLKTAEKADESDETHGFL